MTTRPVPAILDDATRLALDSEDEPQWRRLLDAWQSLSGEPGRYPARRDIDPVQLGTELLPNIFIVDVVRAALGAKPRFRFRLLGQAILDRETSKPGDFLDELGTTSDVAEIERHYLDCLDGKVRLRQASLVWNDVRKSTFTYSVMVLPLADDGANVSHLLGLALYRF